MAQQTKNPVDKQETNKKIYLIETKKNVIEEGSRMRWALWNGFFVESEMHHLLF